MTEFFDSWLTWPWSPQLAWILLLALVTTGVYAIRARIGLASSQQFARSAQVDSDEALRTARERTEQVENALHQAQELVARQRAQLAALQARLEIIARLEQQAVQLREALDAAQAQHARSEHERGLLEARLAETQAAGVDRLKLLEGARDDLRQAFQNLAQELLEEKSRRFSEQNLEQLGGLLQPVREQLHHFEQALRSGQGEDRTQRSLLLKELDSLRSLNGQLSDEANRLTRALRGESQVQGAWGEVVLERLLEAAGLTEGREYRKQTVLRSDDGGRPRPDVILLLPEQRALVLDAKVSLTAYERFAVADTGPAREQALTQHLASIRKHVQDLAGRGYERWLEQRSLDLVLMFVPIEGAFIDAVRAAPELYEQALAQRVVIVSPSTLLATLKTVHHVWRQEQRNQHADEIARRAAKLYDKLAAFVTDLEQARSAVRRADSELDQAFRKLSEGRGNLLAQAERLRDLGVEPSKRLPASAGEHAETADDESD
jgi:DNA recombination protein RmuC